MKTFNNLLLASFFSLFCSIAQCQTTADTVIPEFETIITEAEKAGKDPLEIARYNKEHNIWSMADYIRFSKYNRGKQAKEAAEIEVKIAEKYNLINLKADGNLKNIRNLYLADPNVFDKKRDWLEYINSICMNKDGYYRADILEFVEVNFKKELSVGGCSKPKSPQPE